MTTKKLYNLILLDESGSMQNIKSQIISGFNEIVQTIKGQVEDDPEIQQYVSFVSFNKREIKTHIDCLEASVIKEISENNYLPNSGTPLFDAMGQSIHHLREKTSNQDSANVLVTILTDGYENASTEYNRDAIKSLVEELEQENWTFTYIGADHDVQRAANSISIKNAIFFDKSDRSTNIMFSINSNSRNKYLDKLKKGEDTSEGFFDGDDF